MGHASVNVEREVKFKASLEFELPDLRRLGLGVVQLPVQTLSTSYFDTPDLRLWERRITLRHRFGEGGEAGTWTIEAAGRAEPKRVQSDRVVVAGRSRGDSPRSDRPHTWDRPPSRPRANRRSRSRTTTSVGPEWRLPVRRDRRRRRCRRRRRWRAGDPSARSDRTGPHPGESSCRSFSGRHGPDHPQQPQEPTSITSRSSPRPSELPPIGRRRATVGPDSTLGSVVGYALQTQLGRLLRIRRTAATRRRGPFRGSRPPGSSGDQAPPVRPQDVRSCSGSSVEWTAQIRVAVDRRHSRSGP